MTRLVSLVGFYKIAGWKTWDAGYEENRDSDIDESPQLHFTVHDALHARPEIALQELDSYLGLEYSGVEELKKRAEQMS